MSWRGHREERGASSVEYGLIAVAIAAVIAAVVFALGQIVQGLFSESCDTIATETAAASCP